MAAAGAVIVCALVVLAILGPYIVPYDPVKPDYGKRLLAPSREHLFGTDDLGRDIFSRVVAGCRISLSVGFLVLVFAVALGSLIGGISGYVGGRTDDVVMRLTDLFLAFPPLVLAMAVAAALGRGLTNAMIAITFTWWPWYARLVRGQVLVAKQKLYVEAARSIGLSDFLILFRHVLPNCFPPVLVQASLDIGYAILVTSSLSFIGLGAVPPTPEWGAMVSEGRRFIMDQYWYSLFPGLAIMVTVLGFNLLGDGLRDFLDPALRHTRGQQDRRGERWV